MTKTNNNFFQHVPGVSSCNARQGQQTGTKGRLVASLCLLAALCGVPAAASADNFAFTRLDVTEGLSQGVVNSLTQDQHGFVWLGTQLGLNRYDGTEFRVYTHDPEIPGSLPDDWVWSIYVDRAGQLWVGTDAAGIVRFNERTEQFEHVAPIEGDVRSIVQDADGWIWLASDKNGLGRFNPAAADPASTVTWLHKDNSALNSNRIRELHIDAFGSLWVGTFDDGAYRFDSLLQQLVPLDLPGLDLPGQWDSIRAIAGGGAEPLWLGTSTNGLVKLDLDTGALEHYHARGLQGKNLSSDNIRVLFKDNAGDIWVGHDTDGLDRIESSGQVTAFRTIGTQSSTQSSTLPDDHVNALFQDHSGLMWIGSHRGAAVWNPKPPFFRNFGQNLPVAHGLTEDWVSGFAIREAGSFWVATYGGGVNLVDVESGVVEVLRHDPQAPSLSDDRVMTVYQDRDGILWAGTRSAGLNRYDPQTGAWLTYRHDPQDANSISDNAITSILEDSRGLFWVGTNRGGLNLLDRSSGQFERVQTPDGAGRALCFGRILSIFEARSGALWLGTWGGGICRYDPLTREFQQFRHASDNNQTLSSDAALLIAEDSIGNLWVGTFDAGLNVWLLQDREAGRPVFHRISLGEGLSSRVAYSLLPDSRGRVWVGSNRGLTRIHIQSESGVPEITELRKYTVDDGLPTNEFNFASALRTHSGKMLFGSTAGFTIFQPEATETPVMPPRVALTDLSKFNESVGFNPQLPVFDLNHDDNVVTFEYAALDFAAPKKNRYQHWLEGFDNNWVDDGNRNRATYTNLAPGKYTFRVRAAARNSAWSEDQLNIPVKIAAPPWATVQAYMAYALLTAMLAFWVYRSWSRKLAVAQEIATMNVSLRREVAERQAKDLALKQEQAVAQRYLDVVEVMIVALDREGRVAMVNQKGARILGGEESGLLGVDFYSEFIPMDVRQEVQSSILELHTYLYCETRLMPRMGAERLIAWHVIRLPDDDSKNPGGILMSGTDVTQMRKLEHQLRDAQKMEALGTLARGVAHDFNNILSAILGYSELAKNEVRGHSEVQEYLGRLEGSVGRAKEIINGILTFGRVTNLTPTPTNMTHAVGEAMQLVRPVLPPNVRLVEELEPDCGPVLADSAQIIQILLNLCTNACQSMVGEGGRLEVSLMHVNVDMETSREHRVLQPGLHVRLVVADTGPGMDEYTQARIFEPFFTTRPQGEGTGLGLSVVHGIVTQLNGVIEVETELNQGTRFEITLPCRAEFRPISIDDTPILPAELTGSETVLFVDDETEVVEIAWQGLTHLGYSVITANDGDEALRLLNAEGTHVDLVITDQTMPGIRGEQMAAEVKRRFPDLPVLLVSGADQPSSSFVDDFLSKPYSQQDLVTKIRGLLAKVAAK